MTDDQIADVPFLWQDTILETRHVPEQGLCGTQRFIVTCGLLTGLTFDGLTYDYTARYCYERATDARDALRTWNGEGDPPGPWIKEKLSERLGPGAKLRRAKP
jgi:hypothetical protein